MQNAGHSYSCPPCSAESVQGSAAGGLSCWREGSAVARSPRGRMCKKSKSEETWESTGGFRPPPAFLVCLPGSSRHPTQTAHFCLLALTCPQDCAKAPHVSQRVLGASARAPQTDTLALELCRQDCGGGDRGRFTHKGKQASCQALRFRGPRSLTRGC